MNNNKPNNLLLENTSVINTNNSLTQNISNSGLN